METAKKRDLKERHVNSEDQLRTQMQEVAKQGLQVISEFLEADRGMRSEAWDRITDQAKVGAFALSSFVRHEASINNRDALEMQRAKAVRLKLTAP